MFWERFSALCVESGKSPNGVAKELGIPSGSITAWKNGSIPRSATLIKIASYFNVAVSVLTEESGEKEKSPTPDGVELTATQQKAWDLIIKLDEKSLKRLIKIFEAVLEEQTDE